MNSGKSLIASLKATASRSGSNLNLVVGSPPEALLRPVGCALGKQDKKDVAALSVWRNKFSDAFLTEFEANESRTSNWLNSVVLTDPGRILFMLDDSAGNTFGYMGLAFIDWETGLGEADAVVRGGSARKGLMSECLKVLLNWAQGQLGLKDVFVRVRSDNSALEFYRKFGFEEQERTPLELTENNGEKNWKETPGFLGAEVSLVHMKLKNEPTK